MSHQRREAGRAAESGFRASVLRSRTVAGALIASLIVGTVLTCVYQGGEILNGRFSGSVLAHVLLNYLVPYSGYTVFVSLVDRHRSPAEDPPAGTSRSQASLSLPEPSAPPAAWDEAPSAGAAHAPRFLPESPILREALHREPPASDRLQPHPRMEDAGPAAPRAGELQVVLGPNSGERYAVGVGGLIIGREEDADVILDDPLVSRHHLRVRMRGTEYVAEDLGSRNGTLLNDNRLVAPVRLTDGDRIDVGVTQFQFRLRPVGASELPPQYAALPGSSSADEVVLMAPRSHSGLRVARLEVVGGRAAPSSYLLATPLTAIGRGSENDIVLQDHLASRQHARVMEYNGEYYLHDLGSVNGSRVNRERLDGPVRLRPGDEIAIGGVRLLFSLIEAE